jgi:hypothetical protein
MNAFFRVRIAGTGKNSSEKCVALNAPIADKFDPLDCILRARGLRSALSPSGMHDRKPKQIHDNEKLESAQKYFPACGHGSGQGRTSPPKIFGSPAGPLPSGLRV